MSIWARGLWKWYWIALLRIGKDKRARPFALKVTLSLTYLLAYVLLISFMGVTIAGDGGFWSAAFYTCIFGTGLIATLLVKRSYMQQDESLNLSLTGRSRLHPQDASYISPDVRTYLEERALIVASFLARGAGEIYLLHNPLAPGLEVLTRQSQIAMLREHGLWQKLERDEADLARADDGLWTVEEQHQVVLWCEQLRLLRWVLGMDAELLSLAHVPTLDFSLPREVLQGKAVRAGRPAPKAWDVRVQRDIALGYTARVVAEFKGRGLIADGPELEGWADEFRAKSLGASTDFLAGTRTIGELDVAALHLLGLFAAARQRYSAYLAAQLNAVQPFSFSTWAG